GQHRPRLPAVVAPIGAAAGRRVEGLWPRRVAQHLVYVAVDAARLDLARLVTRLPRQVLVRGEGRRARRPAAILPRRAAVAAARHAALLDAPRDVVAQPRVERDAAHVGGVRRGREGRARVGGERAEARQLAERAAAVLAYV